MRVATIGEPWIEGEEPERVLRRVEWVHVAPLLRDDFPTGTLDRIARRLRLLLDGHGLVRARRLGPLALDGDFDRTILRHAAVSCSFSELARDPWPLRCRTDSRRPSVSTP